MDPILQIQEHLLVNGSVLAYTSDDTKFEDFFRSLSITDQIFVLDPLHILPIFSNFIYLTEDMLQFLSDDVPFLVAAVSTINSELLYRKLDERLRKLQSYTIVFERLIYFQKFGRWKQVPETTIMSTYSYNIDTKHLVSRMHLSSASSDLEAFFLLQ